jgi:hypothetical protein
VQVPRRQAQFLPFQQNYCRHILGCFEIRGVDDPVIGILALLGLRAWVL